MNALRTLFVPDEMPYTGEQLRSLWAFERFDLLGDCAVAFIGPCDVQPQHMKDAEDLKAAARIYSERMLHFIVEHFDADLDRAVLRQRLLIALMAEALNRRLSGEPVGRPDSLHVCPHGDVRRSVAYPGPNLPAPALLVRRVGADLYDGTYKLTVSIASVSPVSALIHAGINISSRNTPVPTRGLDDYGVQAREFGEELLAAYAQECAAAHRSRCKVRPCE